MTSCLISNLSFKYHYLLPLLAKFPQEIAYRLVSYYGKLQLTGHQNERDQMCVQMRRVFPDASEGKISQWADYFFCMQEREKLDTEFFQRLKQNDYIDNFVRLHHHDELLEARKKGRRIFITTGHFGRLWMAGIGLQRHGISVGTITRDSGTDNRQGLPDVEFAYRAKKLRVLQQRLNGPFLVEGNSVRPIYRALDENVMALLIDVPYQPSKEGYVELPFLGRTATFPLGVAKIARKTEALIIPYYTFESRRGIDVEFYPSIEAAELTDEEIMRHLVTLLEQQVLAHPEQWWMWQCLPSMWK
ncbi:MAG: lysophospholipid acyltransferase family protein [Methylococcales bacterium]|nr:lysophospholipid acyltransferase family protein [Methylococcales bacterium]